MKNKIVTLGILLASLISSCTFEQEPVATGKLNDEQVMFGYGIYYTVAAHRNKADVIELVRQKYPDFEIVDSAPDLKDVKSPQVLITEITNVKEDFTPPDLAYLEHTSYGLSDEQKEILQTSDFVILLDFFCPEPGLLSSMQKANELIAELVVNENDIIWDSETRECYTKKFWVADKSIKANSLNISHHINIHIYPKGDSCRAITLGMLKFGLPDICIENISCKNTQKVIRLIQLTAQTLFETKRIDEVGKLHIDIDLLLNQDLKTYLLKSLEENAEKKANINLIEGVWEKGDSRNRIFEIAFSKENPQTGQQELMNTIFGSKKSNDISDTQ